jgi:type II secretory pathway component PulM
VQLVGQEKDKLRADKLEEKNRARQMIFWPVVFFVGIVVILILWKPRSRTESWTEMSAEEKYLLANKILSRDPQNFKDKDSDGVEDELEKGS